MHMEIKQSFGLALKSVRRWRDLSQEDFSNVSGRTYLSCIERGLKSPTIDKLDELASVLEVHPVTLLALCYLGADPRLTPEHLLMQVQHELKAVTDPSAGHGSIVHT